MKLQERPANLEQEMPIHFKPSGYSQTGVPSKDIGQRYSTTTSSRTQVVKIIKTYQGIIEEIDGLLVVARLIDSEQQEYTADLSTNTFEPGGPVVTGNTFEAQWVLMGDHSERWRNLPDPIVTTQHPELQKAIEHYGREFAGTGL